MWNGFALRRATKTDGSAVQALFAEHLAALGYAPDEELDADMVDFPAGYATYCFWVAVAASGELAAMGGIKDGEIRRLFVRPNYRGQGLAKRILLELLRFHRRGGGLRVRAVVGRTNSAARAIFQASGFLGTGKSPAHPKMVHCEQFELSFPPRTDRAVAVVTGGARGLGRHLVETLTSDHDLVFTWRRSSDAAESVAEQVRAAGGWALPVRCDVTEAHQLEHLAELTATVAGPCRALIHNVGHFSLASLKDVTPEVWQEELSSTVTAAFWAFRAFEAQLLSQPHGRMITIGDSGADKIKSFGKSLGYYVGKHGVLLVTKSVAAHWQGQNATCNCVSPGVMPNSIDLDQPGMKPNVQFAEIAGIIRFLLSPTADAINGAHIIASRGWNV